MTDPPYCFTITILGSSGGPIEGTTSSYLIKPASLTYKQIIDGGMKDCVVAVDAGSGLGKFVEMIADEIHGCPGRLTETTLRHYLESLDIESYTSPTVLSNSQFLGLDPHCTTQSPVELAFELADIIQSILITHPHMDHIAALIVNSPAFGHDSGKHIYGLPSTVQALQEFVFNDYIWPNLSSHKNGTFLDFVEVEPRQRIQLSPRFTTTPFTLSHGCTSGGGRYNSTAYLLEEQTTMRQLLIFGDVEADSYSHGQSNITIWNHIAPCILQKTLRTIVIECSTPNLPPGQPLYGHMTPDALFSELITLNEILSQRGGSLRGIDFLITHVKERRSKCDPRVTIFDELHALNEKHNLGCNFTIVLPGQTYSVA